MTPVEQNKRISNILHGPVAPTLLRLAAPMVLGMASIILFNVVDTFFVGQLGAIELAAMSFTFPVVYVVLSVSLGLSIATTSVISRTIGGGDLKQVRRLTTHALILANIVVVVLCGIGLLTIDPLFRLLGAPEEVLPLIRQYMIPWYIGVGFLVIPMVGNGAIRATGDTKTPSYIMIFAGVINTVLDPLLIFGLGPFPRLELQGAAIATLIGRSLTFMAAFWILFYRERMVQLAVPKLRELLDSWRRILYVGIPSAGAKMLVPMSTGVLTRMVAEFGPFAVAGFGVGQRLEPLVLIVVGALGSAATTFVGQNYGAGQLQRVEQALRFCFAVAMGWGFVVALLLALAASPLASLFNQDPEVIRTAVLFLWLVPVSYGLYGVAMLAMEVYNAINKPLRAVALIVIRLFVLAIPLAWLGAQLWGAAGIFVGMAVSNITIGLIAYFTASRFLARRTG